MNILIDERPKLFVFELPDEDIEKDKKAGERMSQHGRTVASTIEDGVPVVNQLLANFKAWVSGDVSKTKLAQEFNEAM